MRDWSVFHDGLYHHHIRHIYFTRSKHIKKINNTIFKNKIKKLIKEHKIEIVIVGPSHYLHGHLPRDLGVPVIFDYVDFLYDFKDPNKEDTKLLSEYFNISTKILCVSKTLMNSLPNRHKIKAEYIPNGVDLDFYKSYSFTQDKYNTKYISLIGISISESPFYLDVFPKIKEKLNNIKMLLVGGGPRFPMIKNYIDQRKDKNDFILTGYIPYGKIRKYFYMTDVGLYPTLKNRYYDSACPLKVMEYSAASRPVVATDLEELRKLNFPNVFLANPTSKDYEEKIIKALNYNGPFPNLEEFTWKNIAKKLEKTLLKI
ncbi:MAG: glycosyltransferase family 4 protein [Candidatus Odinarchaeota archaeon]